MKEPSLKNFETRKPIIDHGSAEQYIPDQIDQQWRLLTEAVRRDILSKPEIRDIVSSYISSPVDELLPKKLLDELSSDNRIERLKERYSDQILEYLNLDAIPEDQINPDVRNAVSLTKADDVIERLQEMYGIDTPEYYQRLKQRVESGVFLRGITAQERLMVIQRFRFARDIKFLALQAEVLSIGEKNIQINDRNEVVLPSGTSIKLNLEDEVKRQELLSPQNWKKRRQLKDRVYEIQIGSSKYILKEKKTARHSDTVKHGHVPGLSSLEEFQTAQHFQEKGVVDLGDIKVSWEKPVSTITFPDGFQFTIFECEDGLLEEESITHLLTQEIIKNKEQYEKEFIATCSMAEKFKEDPRVLAFEHGSTESGLKAIIRWMGLSKEKIPELTFEDFALIKALRIKRKARGLMQETIIRNGYSNRDSDGYAYKINQQNGKPQLEIFGFDFEYFLKIDQGEIEDRVKRHRDFEQNRENKDGVSFAQWHNKGLVTKMQRAGYFAILQAEGLLQQE
jgi:hypothetical protein